MPSLYFLPLICYFTVKQLIVSQPFPTAICNCLLALWMHSPALSLHFQWSQSPKFTVPCMSAKVSRGSGKANNLSDWYMSRIFKKCQVYDCSKENWSVQWTRTNISSKNLVKWTRCSHWQMRNLWVKANLQHPFSLLLYLQKQIFVHIIEVYILKNDFPFSVFIGFSLIYVLFIHVTEDILSFYALFMLILFIFINSLKIHTMYFDHI